MKKTCSKLSPLSVEQWRNSGRVRKMKILVACEESQAVTIELRKLGHEAYSCDIIECSGGHPEWHIMQDVLQIINPSNHWGDFGEIWTGISFLTMDKKYHGFYGKWDMIIAFPPCTYLSNAGACRLYPQKGVLNTERYQKGLEAKEFFMQFYDAVCDKIAIENPISSKIYSMPKHTQEIQPYMFGDPYTKKTRLWLKGLPALAPTNIISPIAPWVPSGTGRKIKDKYGAAGRGKDPINRAKTFPGIAKAMAEQWAGEKNALR